MMAPFAQSTAQIFEDPASMSVSKHKRVQSAGDILRGRRKENSPVKPVAEIRNNRISPSPLGERHINSPPQPKRIPPKSEETQRPPMHKKTLSSTSFKTLLMGRDKSSGNSSTQGHSPERSPQKTKSSTNFVGLLKKKSRRDLQDDVQNGELKVHTEAPIDALEYSPNKNRFLQHNNHVPEPRKTLDFQDCRQNDPYGLVDDGLGTDLITPRRPFLEHKASRSSIFTENLEEENPEALLTHAPYDDYTYNQSATTSQSRQNAVIDQARVSAPARSDIGVKRSSRILDTIAALKMKARREADEVFAEPSQTPLSPHEIDSAMEQMLGRYDIPQNLRDQLRNLKPEVKAGLMKGDRIGSGCSENSREAERGRDREKKGTGSNEEEQKDGKQSRSRSRTKSRILSLSRRNDASPKKPETGGRSRSKSRPKSIDISRPLTSKIVPASASSTSLNTPDSAVTPGDFIHYLKEVQKPELVEVGKLHKLRILLRNESVTWTDAFVKKGGMDEIVQLLYRVMKIEWRAEHEDSLLHETLLCLKGLSTTSLAMHRLEELSTELFPALLQMLFDPERKGPAEYNTRGIIISLMFAHLSATLHRDTVRHQARTREILAMMQDTQPSDDKQPLEFVTQMHTVRPYRTWCKEVTNVTKEVFWIFLHHLNVVPVLDLSQAAHTDYAHAHFPSLRAPHPAAPYVGGVEWEATQYLALHLDLLNGLIVSLPTTTERNRLREDLRQSGWEKVMGGSLRTCKEKFYGAVHDGLKTWVAAAQQDGWYLEDVRAGPPRNTVSPKKSPSKKPGDEAPQIALDMATSGLETPTEYWL